MRRHVWTVSIQGSGSAARGVSLCPRHRHRSRRTSATVSWGRGDCGGRQRTLSDWVAGAAIVEGGRRRLGSRGRLSGRCGYGDGSELPGRRRAGRVGGAQRREVDCAAGRSAARGGKREARRDQTRGEERSEVGSRRGGSLVGRGGGERGGGEERGHWGGGTHRMGWMVGGQEDRRLRTGRRR